MCKKTCLCCTLCSVGRGMCLNGQSVNLHSDWFPDFSLSYDWFSIFVGVSIRSRLRTNQNPDNETILVWPFKEVQKKGIPTITVILLLSPPNAYRES